MPCKALRRRQLKWARSNGIAVSGNGYTNTLADNLMMPMSAATAEEFGAGNGYELRPAGPTRPPKMHALHSSSALACNVFDYWRHRNLNAVGSALGLSSPIKALRFEAPFPTGLPGVPPNLDLALWLESGEVAGIESKFTEPYCGRRTVPPFKDKYFRDEVPIWSEVGLPRSGALAGTMQAGHIRFRYLDAAQLLKHALGLHAVTQSAFSLIYLYARSSGDADVTHEAEIAQFAAAISDEFEFQAVAYQVLIPRLRKLCGAGHTGYFEYIVSRYLSSV